MLTARMKRSRKGWRGVYISDLAAFIDEKAAAGRRECQKLLCRRCLAQLAEQSIVVGDDNPRTKIADKGDFCKFGAFVGRAHMQYDIFLDKKMRSRIAIIFSQIIIIKFRYRLTYQIPEARRNIFVIRHALLRKT